VGWHRQSQAGLNQGIQEWLQQFQPRRWLVILPDLPNLTGQDIEQLITSCINELCELAVKDKDHASQIFLQWFVTEQIEEENNDRDLIAKLKLVGDNGHGILMIDGEMAARVFVAPPGSPLAV
jgi:hypothetical protein